MNADEQKEITATKYIFFVLGMLTGILLSIMIIILTQR